MSTDLELYKRGPAKPPGRKKAEIEPIDEPLEPGSRERVVKPGAKKFSAWEERQIIIDCCEMKSQELMEKWNVTKDWLYEFRKRHSHEIQALLDNSSDAYAGLWAANKAMRIAAMQERAENLPRGTEGTRIFTMLMKEISDQLGQTPTKTGVVMTNPVVHYYEGFNPDDI